MSAALETLLDHPAIWRPGAARGGKRAATLPTGFPALDARLPGGGWPLEALTEIVIAKEGAGELSILLPALIELAARERWIVWVAPPHVPYAPALARHDVDLARLLWIRSADPAEQLWAAEQCLRSGSCGAVLLWSAEADHRRLRRLQLAAEQGKAWGVLFRYASARAADAATPAALRLQVTPADGGLEVEVLKCRGKGGGRIDIDIDDGQAAAAGSSAPSSTSPGTRPGSRP